MKVLAAYDGTLHAKYALEYGLKQARQAGGEAVVLQVFDRSVFIDYEAGPRAEEMARVEAVRFAREARELAVRVAQDVPVRYLTAEGDAEIVILQFIAEERPDLVVAPRRLRAVQRTSAVPVHILPGTVLVPVDNSESPLVGAAEIAAAAKDLHADVVLLGIVPVHLYGITEQEEVQRVRKATMESVAFLRLKLGNEGLTVKDAFRSGYPDEEILKAAEEFRASIVMLPSGGPIPSELTKASAILSERTSQLTLPIHLVTAGAS